MPPTRIIYTRTERNPTPGTGAGWVLEGDSDVIEPAKWKFRPNLPDGSESGFDLDFDLGDPEIDFSSDYEAPEPDPLEDGDKGDGTVDESSLPKTFDRRNSEPCATLLGSRALSDPPLKPGEYPAGEIEFWNSMLNDPKVPEEIKKKIRAWNGSRNRAKDLRARQGRSFQDLVDSFNWDNLGDFWDKLNDYGENLGFKMFEETLQLLYDQFVFSELIDMAVNESLSGIPILTPTFDPIEYIQKLIEREGKGSHWNWVLSQIKGNVQAMMFRDLFANMYESILAFIRLAKGRRGNFGTEYEGMTEGQYLRALLEKLWNAEGNPAQAAKAMNELEDITYYDMANGWMDWFKKNDKKYNEDNPSGPWKGRCKERDDDTKKLINSRRSNSLNRLMNWSKTIATTGGVGDGFGLSGVGSGG